METFWLYTHMMSIDAAMKGYLPVSEKFFPFVDFSLGLNVFPLDEKVYNKQNKYDYIGLGGSFAWFDMKLGAGIDYHLVSKEGVNANLGYFRLGVRL